MLAYCQCGVNTWRICWFFVLSIRHK